MSGWSWSLTLTWGWEHFWVVLCIWTLGPSELYLSPALPGDLEGGLGLPLGCWWIVCVVLTSTFSSYSCVLITSQVFKSGFILHSVCWVVTGSILVCFVQNEYKCVRFQGLLGEKIRCFHPKVIAKVWTLSSLHGPDLFISQRGPSGNP